MRDIQAFRVAVITVVMTVFSACASNPIAEAQTFEQKTYALYGMYVIAQGKAAELVQDAVVPERVKTALREADRVSYPIAEGLVDAAVEVGNIRGILEQCYTPEEPDPTCVPTNERRLANAMTNLSTIYFNAQPVLLNLVNVVNRAK